MAGVRGTMGLGGLGAVVGSLCLVNSRRRGLTWTSQSLRTDMALMLAEQAGVGGLQISARHAYGTS